MKYSLIALTCLVVLSCKTELDIFEPGKDTVSVYAILNANEPVQNIRINKVFLTDGDAMLVAKDPTQINFEEGELTVTLERFVDGSDVPAPTTVGNLIKKKIVLTDTLVNTQGGTFTTRQRLWQTRDKLYSWGDYKLTITNNISGAVYTSVTSMVDSVKSFGWQQPMPFLYYPNTPGAYPVHGKYPKTVSPADKLKYLNYVVLDQVQYIKFYTVPHARTYGMTMRFHYIDTLKNHTTRPGFVDYNFFQNDSKTTTGGMMMEDFHFVQEDFYKNLGYEMSKKDSPDVKRRSASHIEFIITAGSDDLATFLKVNEPSKTIAQDKPNYSNIKGGYGIFSSRSVSRLSKDLWPEFVDKIACNQYTNPYRFCNYLGFEIINVCP